MADSQLIGVAARTQLTINFDGSCAPINPGGIASAGWVIRGPGDAIIAKGHREVCRGDKATNNVAEYAALVLALKWLARNPIHAEGAELKILGDSQIVVYQVSGKYKCRADHLRKLLDAALELLNKALPVASWSAEWIPREQNAEADALSQLAYEEATGEKYPHRM